MRTALLATLALLQLSAGGAESRRAGAVHIVASKPSEMVRVPSGAFTMGMPDPAGEYEFLFSLCMEDYRMGAGKICHDVVTSFQSSTPAREVQLAAFEMDRYEVTVEQYRQCVRAGACDAGALLFADQRHNRPGLPVGNVQWQDAGDYCKWRGKRLPTEAEWEKAARGPESQRFPWGNRWTRDAANHGRLDFKDEIELVNMPGGSTINGISFFAFRYAVDKSDGYAYASPPGSMIWGESPYGAMDMAGNVSEWVFDFYSEEGYGDLPTVNPIRSTASPVEKRRVLRGGSWLQSRILHLAYARHGESPILRAVDIGFRCAR